MELGVGTIKTDVKTEKTRKKRSQFATGNGSGGKGGKRGGGGGDNGGSGDDYPFFEDRKSFEANKYRLGMFFALLIVMMTFGGIVSAYIVIATNKSPEWQPFNLPVQVWISTLLLIAGSVTYEISKIKLLKDAQISARSWLSATGGLGGIFIASQLLAWLELYNQGYYLKSNPYAGFFYFLTALHAIHVVAGIGSVGYILLRLWNPAESAGELEKRQLLSKVIGWFWHFLTVIWIVLVILLSLYK